MNDRHILLLGANGQVGQAIRAEPLPAGWQLHCYGHGELDITDHRATQIVLHEIKPDIIVNAAAMTAVDACETDHDKALAINFEAMANIAAQASAIDAPIIHLSTDYVFDGRDGAVPYKPDDKVNPLSIYGDSKFMGEEVLRHEFPWHVILRVSSVFSAFGRNLLTGIVQTIEEKDEIRAASDQIASPTYAPDIAKAVLTVAASILGGKPDGFGTFHLCGAPPATRVEFVQAIMDAWAPYGKKRARLTPVTLKETSAGRAERPAYSVLDCGKIRAVYGVEQTDWRVRLSEAVATLARRQA
jgi:dTDP-4-dehydrorhamnose reductase